jgi:hypothetical protein
MLREQVICQWEPICWDKQRIEMWGLSSTISSTFCTTSAVATVGRPVDLLFPKSTVSQNLFYRSLYNHTHSKYIFLSKESQLISYKGLCEKHYGLYGY